MCRSMSKTSGFRAAVSARASAKLMAVPTTSIPSSFVSNCLMAARMTSLSSTNSNFIDITASGLTESDVSSIACGEGPFLNGLVDGNGGTNPALQMFHCEHLRQRQAQLRSATVSGVADGTQ